MFATHNSVVRRGVRRLLTLTLAAGVGFAPGAGGSRAEETNRARPAVHAQQLFAAAQKKFNLEPTNPVAAWEFARTGFDRAEFATNDAERAAIAVQAIAACRKLIARESNSAPAHYYLGMNLGQLARTKLLGALPIVDEMEREFKVARALDERMDHAGPDRNLGLLYFEAPSIGSVGDRTKARKHLERAAELAPEFPENRLNLAEAYLKWQDKKPLHRELDALKKIWPAAKTNFAGADWEAAWLDWQRRNGQLRAKAGVRP
ncbi:MAG: hypothetical protein EXS35_17815 [Pedosphaera sp.]|nr:hypothetical protein [Pedosphaera sp.]